MYCQHHGTQYFLRVSIVHKCMPTHLELKLFVISAFQKIYIVYERTSPILCKNGQIQHSPSPGDATLLLSSSEDLSLLKNGWLLLLLLRFLDISLPILRLMVSRSSSFFSILSTLFKCLGVCSTFISTLSINMSAPSLPFLMITAFFVYTSIILFAYSIPANMISVSSDLLRTPQISP